MLPSMAMNTGSIGRTTRADAPSLMQRRPQRMAQATRNRSMICCRLGAPDAADGATRRTILLSGVMMSGFGQTKAATATDFAEVQAEREARKQAILEAARAKATGEPVPEMEQQPAYEAPKPSLDTSKLSYPRDEPSKQEKDEKKTPAKKSSTSKASKAGNSRPPKKARRQRRTNPDSSPSTREVWPTKGLPGKRSSLRRPGPRRLRDLTPPELSSMIAALFSLVWKSTRMPRAMSPWPAAHATALSLSCEHERHCVSSCNGRSLNYNKQRAAWA